MPVVTRAMAKRQANNNNDERTGKERSIKKIKGTKKPVENQKPRAPFMQISKKDENMQKQQDKNIIQKAKKVVKQNVKPDIKAKNNIEEKKAEASKANEEKKVSDLSHIDEIKKKSNCDYEPYEVVYIKDSKPIVNNDNGNKDLVNKDKDVSAEDEFANFVKKKKAALTDIVALRSTKPEVCPFEEDVHAFLKSSEKPFVINKVDLFKKHYKNFNQSTLTVLDNVSKLCIKYILSFKTYKRVSSHRTIDPFLNKTI